MPCPTCCDKWPSIPTESACKVTISPLPWRRVVAAMSAGLSSRWHFDSTMRVRRVCWMVECGGSMRRSRLTLAAAPACHVLIPPAAIAEVEDVAPVDTWSTTRSRWHLFSPLNSAWRGLSGSLLWGLQPIDVWARVIGTAVHSGRPWLVLDCDGVAGRVGSRGVASPAGYVVRRGMRVRARRRIA